MKKMTTIGMMIFMLSMSLPVMGAMSISKMRQNARFLTDKMTYELKLSMMQYDDVYEVNYDFINNIRYIMDDVVRGHGYAVERYYEYLDIRNDDLRWILTNSQYRRFMDVDYFYRPIYTTQNNWLFRIYKTYLDKNLFYYGKPHHYKSYKGEHYRVHHNYVSFYKSNHKNKYNHSVYKGDVKVKRNPVTKPSANPSNKRKDTNVEKKNDKKNVHSNNNRRENVQRKDKPAVSSNKAKVETSSRKSAEVKADNRNARRTATSNGKRSTRSSSGSRSEAKERK